MADISEVQNAVDAVVDSLSTEGPEPVGPSPESAGEYRNINTEESWQWLESVLAGLPDSHIVAMDNETVGLYCQEDTVAGFSLSWEEGKAAYIPYCHVDCPEVTEERTEKFRVLLESLKRFRLVFHKSFFDTAFTQCSFGVSLPIWDDTYMICRLLELPLSLDDAMSSMFGFGKPVDFKIVMKEYFGHKWKSEGYTIADMPAEKVYTYGSRDADFTRRLYYRVKPMIKQYKMEAIHKLEVNMLEPSRDLNLTGMPADAEVAQILTDLIKRQNKIRLAKLHELAGEEWNPNSNPQKQKILFGKLKLPVIKKSKVTGLPSCDAEVMEELEHAHEIIPVLREYLQYNDLVTDFLSKVPHSIDANGLMYSEFNPYGAGTGRFTSKGTTNHKQEIKGGNLQNVSHKMVDFKEVVPIVIPEGTCLPAPDIQDGVEVYDFLTLRKHGFMREGAVGETQELMVHFLISARQIMNAPEGWVWIKGDLSQVEYRLAASLSGETYLIDKFKEGWDFHTITASLFLDVSLDDVTKEQRKMGKTINFCVPLDTQALTKDGWKYYKDIKVGDLVLGYKDGGLEWTPVLDTVLLKDQEVVDLKHRYFEFRCTPNHRWLSRKRSAGGTHQGRFFKERMVEAQDITSEDNLVISARAVGGDSPITPKEAAIIAWVLGDGSIQKGKLSKKGPSQAGGRKVAFRVGIFQKKFVQTVDNLLVDVPHKRYVRPKTEIVSWYLNPDWAMALWQKARLIEDGPEKFVMSLSQDAREAFLEAIWQAEGSYTCARYGIKTGRKLYQNEGHICEAMKLATFLEGFMPSISKRAMYTGSIMTSISMSKPRVTGQRLRMEPAGREDVWCMTTGLGTWVARQRDTITLTGNCLQYGGGPDKVAKVISISKEEARTRLGLYWSRIPKMQAFSGWIRDEVLKKGYVSSYFGRRLTVKTSGVSKSQIEAEIRRCQSQRIQGTAAEFMKIGMLRVLFALADLIAAGHVKFIATVHDELDFLVKQEYVEEVCKIIKRGMEVPTPPEWAPLIADVSTGKSWAERDQEKVKFPDWVPDAWDTVKKWSATLPPTLVPHAEV